MFYDLTLSNYYYTVQWKVIFIKQLHYFPPCRLCLLLSAIDGVLDCESPPSLAAPSLDPLISTHALVLFAF